VLDAKTSAKKSLEIVAGGRSKQLRSIATREQLVDAARDIFARDGFDLARLEDIAAAAGKTRGAFYAHFQNKEDVFFAIFEEDKARDRAQLRTRLSTASCRQERVEILARHLFTLLKDRRRMLLNLEFKMYAIRHPHKQKRLTDLHAAMCTGYGETSIDHLLPELRHSDPAFKRAQAAQFGALLDGLALNRLFDAVSLDPELVLRHLRTGIDFILDRPNPQGEVQDPSINVSKRDASAR
jgi:AcrR family transcriptional regulator